ncbi:MAG: 23S rRNA (uracil(1939)-C(5))-methyltransferase RlmD, partial [Candidatus Scatosoma sp.]
ISNMTALLGDVKTVLPTLVEEKENCAIVLDPPRSGCEKEVLETVVDFAPDTLVYVSCNPATLARDVRILSEQYAVVSVTPYDMFPQTNHVETVAVLSKKA